MNNKKITIISTIIIIIITIGGLLGFNHYKQKYIVDGVKNIIINVNIDGNATSKQVKTECDFLGEYIRADVNFKYSDSSYGVFIEGINDKVCDSKKQEWWGIVINDEFSQTGVDSIAINNNDIIEFRLMTGYNE